MEIERKLIYMMCKFQLVWLMHMRITIVFVKLVLGKIKENSY
jgi:hypothetical protein